MASEVDYNKIIKKGANGVFKPHGLFQKGSSRVWIDDNGWYLTVVEFQPSAWDKGTYLNVSVHFLWDEKDYLSYDYYTGRVPRMEAFVRFDGDEARFLSDVQHLAEAALERVMQYRQLRDLHYAQASILQFRAFHIINTLYPQMMICGLNHDPKARTYFNRLLEELPQYADVAWTGRIHTELTESIAPIIGDPERFYGYICAKVEKQRAFWQSKSSMKKLSKTVSM